MQDAHYIAQLTHSLLVVLSNCEILQSQDGGLYMFLD
jgi:hypothetical protein